MAGVTPRQVYDALTGAGFSSVQALGLMGNAYAESSLNPEAVNPGGPSQGVGLFQWTTGGNYNINGLVTGNPQKDLQAQARYAAQTIRGPAVAGSTPQQVAGNVAALFERCATCVPRGNTGPNGYTTRVANAAMIAGWARSGKWPATTRGTSPGAGAGGGATGGGAAGGGAGASAQLTAAKKPGGSQSTCLMGNPFSASVGPITLGQNCLIPKSWARVVLGIWCVAGGAIVALTGITLVLKEAAGATGAGRAAGTAADAAGTMLALFPPAEGAGVAVSAMGRRANRVASYRAGQRRESRMTRSAATSEQRAATAQERLSRASQSPAS